MGCISRSRVPFIIILIPCLIYVLHIPFVLQSAGYRHRQGVLIQRHFTAIQPREQNGNLQKHIYIYDQRPGPNITDILEKKKMGGILKEMDEYRRLMKAALEKGEQSQRLAKAIKGKKVEKEFEKKSLDLIREMYNKNVTNFFHTLKMKVVTPFMAGYIINNESLCTAGNHALTYLVYVHSATGNVERRVNLRKTWAQPDLFPQFPSRLVFFVGRVLKTDQRKQARLEAEATLFGDIVQIDFLDTYHNLSYKAMGAMRWISEFCPNTDYVFKTDDDVYVNMPAMMFRLTTEFSTRLNFIMGMIWRFPSLHIQRPGKLCSQWCIPFDVLAGLDHYPTYASGSFYIMTQDVAAQLYDMAQRTPFFWVDDAHITGIVAARIPALEHIDITKAYRFNLAVYKEKLGTSNPLIVTLTGDLVNLWKYHLPRIAGPYLSLLGEENHQELLNVALKMR